MHRVPAGPPRRLVHGRDPVNTNSTGRGGPWNGIDVIGDVHGAIEHLEALLETLGYRSRHGSRRHPDGRLAVFVGDLIDRGPGQIETIRLVRDMVDAGDAACVMGNHEYNAIAWYHGLRARDEHRRRQHEAFLTAVGEDSALHRELVEWFATLPLTVETLGMRVVHACWDQEALGDIAPFLRSDATLVDDGYVLAHDPARDGGRVHRAVEHLLKGPEIALPEDAQYIDKDGKTRSKARYAWWATGTGHLADVCVIPGDVVGTDGKPHRLTVGHPVTSVPCPPYRDRVPVIVGHYWCSGEPAPLSDKVACVDYSAVRGGPLCAYRYDGEDVLRREKFVAARPEPRP